MPWTSVIDKKQIPRHVAFILAVGIASACTSIILCLCVNAAYHVCKEFAWTVYFLPLLGVASLGFYKLMKLPYDYSTDDLILQMRRNEPVSPTLAPGILVGTCFTILGGGAVGKESSAFQMGASIGEVLGRAFKLQNVFTNKADRNVYGYAAIMGMSATFSALFFAPLGAVFLVLELTRFKMFNASRFFALLVSAFIAASIAYPFGIGDIIPRIEIPALTAELMLQVVLIGIVGGLLGRIFGGSLHAVRSWRRNNLRHPYISVIVSSIVIVVLLLSLNLQDYEGSGMNLLTQALAGSIGTWDFAIKAGIVFLALAFGLKGGEIMPTLAIGGLLGCSLGQIANIDPAFAAAVGVLTFFTGMTRCPIAAFFLGCEVFGFGMAPYLAVGVLFAYFGSHDLGYYGKGLLSKSHSAKREQKAIKKFIDENPSLESALTDLEKKSVLEGDKKEQTARKESAS